MATRIIEKIPLDSPTPNPFGDMRHKTQNNLDLSSCDLTVLKTTNPASEPQFQDIPQHAVIQCSLHATDSSTATDDSLFELSSIAKDQRKYGSCLPKTGDGTDVRNSQHWLVVKMNNDLTCMNHSFLIPIGKECRENGTIIPRQIQEHIGQEVPFSFELVEELTVLKFDEISPKVMGPHRELVVSVRFESYYSEKQELGLGKKKAETHDDDRTAQKSRPNVADLVMTCSAEESNGAAAQEQLENTETVDGQGAAGATDATTAEATDATMTKTQSPKRTWKTVTNSNRGKKSPDKTSAGEQVAREVQKLFAQLKTRILSDEVRNLQQFGDLLGNNCGYKYGRTICPLLVTPMPSKNSQLQR